MNPIRNLLGLSFPILLGFTLLLLTTQLSAQDAVIPASHYGWTDFKAGYFGNVFDNNGLEVGVEHLWSENVKIKERKKGPKTVLRHFLFHGNLGYSTNFSTSTQNGLFAYSGVILRRVNAKSRERSIAINPLGIYRSVLPTTFEVVGDDVTRVALPGRNYYAPSVSIGIGRFRRATKRSGWYLNLQGTVLTNYNAGILPIFSLHFGRKFNFRKK